MKLWDRITQRSDAVRQGYWEGMASGAAVFSNTYGSPDRESILPTLTSFTNQAYGGNSVVFSVIAARIALFADARFCFQSLADKHIYGSEDLRVLEYPWPNGTTGELLGRMEQDISLAGNAYILKTTDRLVRLRPDWITIVSEMATDEGGRRYRKVTGYNWEPPKDQWDAWGRPQLYTIDEVAHWTPTPDPLAQFRGMSWLTPTLRDIQADSGMTQYKTKYLENAASPNLLIKYANRLNADVIDRVRERFQARYAGAENAFKTVILDEGADATIIGSNFQQMEFANVQDAGAARVCAAGGVDPILVGLVQSRTAAIDYPSAMRRLADVTIRPNWRSVCATLQKFVPNVPAKGVRLWFDTTDVAAIREAEAQRTQNSLIQAQTILALTQAGYDHDSCVKAVTSDDMSQLKFVQPPPGAVVPGQPTGQAGRPPNQQVQHLLPQQKPGVVAEPLPAGSVPRLPVGSTSPGDGGNSTRPTRRPTAARRDDGVWHGWDNSDPFN